MKPPADRSTDETAPAIRTTVFGARWGVGLGAALLVALALVTATRWLEKAGSANEQIVQIPVPVAAPSPPPRPEVLAPDPGDTP